MSLPKTLYDPIRNKVGKYNSLFGVIEVKATSESGTATVFAEEGSSDANLKDYVKREFGIGRKQQKNINLINALTNPAEYFAAKNSRLEDINVIMTNRYKTVYLI